MNYETEVRSTPMLVLPWFGSAWGTRSKHPPCMRLCLISLFLFLAVTMLIPSKAIADGVVLGLAAGELYNNCSVTPHITTETTAILDCDRLIVLNGAGGYDEIRLLGFSVASFWKNPKVDVRGSAWTLHGAYNSGEFSAFATVTYYMTVDRTAIPPAYVGTIPVTMTWMGETSLVGWGTEPVIFATFAGIRYNTPGTENLQLLPGSKYSATIYASCGVGTTWFTHDSKCQAVADPLFEFDQAAFDAQMGSQTFELADYYDFAYSPNLNDTPEPASLLLLGTGLVGAVGVIRRKIST